MPNVRHASPRRGRPHASSAAIALALCLIFNTPLASAQPAPMFDDAGHGWSEPSASATRSLARDAATGADARQIDAAGPTWQRRSPDGADIATIAYAPDGGGLMLAGAFSAGTGIGGGLYRSDDGGDSWKEDAAFTGLAVHDIEFDADGAVYIATADGIFHSRSAGPAWTRRALGIGSNDAVLDIAIDPARPGTLWAGIGDAQGLQPKNLLHSIDGGLNWIDRTPPVGHALGCTSIAIDPADPDHIVAVFTGAFGGGQVWVSNDGGIDWQERSGELANQSLRTVAFAGARLLVGGGQRLGQQLLGLYASDDDGAHWFALNGAQAAAPVVTAIAVAPRDRQQVWIATDGQGVRRSRDGGHSWAASSANTETLSVTSLQFRPGSDDTLAIGAVGAGVLRSRDGGIRFAPSADGMTALDVRTLAIDPHDSSRVAISVAGLNDGRVFASNDAGRSWALQSLPATRFNALQFAPDGALHAVSGGPSTVAAEGLYRRGIDGSWQSLGPDQGPQYETDIRAIGFSKQQPGWIMLAGSDYGSAGFEGTLWRSRDHGAHWTKVHESSGRGAFVDLVLMPRRAGTRILAVFDDTSGAGQGRVIASDDDGDRWQDASTGLPSAFADGRLCTGANVDTAHFSLRLPDGSGQLYRSRDGGASWQARSTAGDGILDIACDRERDNALYAVRQASASLPRRVEYSDDGGASFKRIDKGLDALSGNGALAIGSDRSGTTLWMTSAQGAWMQAR